MIVILQKCCQYLIDIASDTDINKPANKSSTHSPIPTLMLILSLLNTFTINSKMTLLFQ